MKNRILTAIAVMASLCGYAQTKGTNALSLSIGVNTQKYESGTNEDMVKQETKSNRFGLGYGLFVKDNAKLGVDLLFNTSETTSETTSGESSSKFKGYGGNVNYQQYYPIVKKLYAYAGGRVGYMYSKSEDIQSDDRSTIGHQYNLAAYGGITWFFSKRFALETSLLSANIRYAESDYKAPGNAYNSRSKSTTFDFSGQGFIDDLGFKIYLLF